ncbi:MAG TPA: TRAP transporter small permease subunit [Burkholderiales bacterium]|nr:TRAP transporter small permease subunit [Burkholderiales bacterium]
MEVGKLGRWLRRRAENIAAAMVAVMFAAFVLQILFRYFLNFPVGWTSELSVVLWLWLVLWGAAFVVKERDEIRFDLLSELAGRRVRIVMGMVAALALLVLYGMSLKPSFDYVSFMKVEKSSYLKIRMDWLFSIYVVFVLAVLVRYLWLLWQLVRGRDPLAGDGTHAGSGL